MKIEMRAWDGHGNMFHQRTDTLTDHGAVLQLPSEDGLPESERIWYPASEVLFTDTTWTVMLWTNGLDSKGNKIFDRDIIRVVYRDNTHIFLVRFIGCGFDVTNVSTRLSLGSLDECLALRDHVEVIGNEFQNPELLQ